MYIKTKGFPISLKHYPCVGSFRQQDGGHGSRNTYLNFRLEKNKELWNIVNPKNPRSITTFLLN